MTSYLCDKCGEEITGWPASSVEIKGSFFRKMKAYDLCTDCDKRLRNLVAGFLEKCSRN
jgi:DNA-directed RNA polymerase subunit RPC12/RpoP